MSYKNGADKIRTAWRVAKEIPEKMTAFLTKMLNIWVQAKENGYMDMAKWKACQVDKIPIDTHGMSVYVGFDMSAKIDLTSVTFVIPFLSGEFDKTGKEIVKYILYSHSFIPNREKLAERKAKDKVDYDAWERMGFITVTDTPIVDQNAVMQYVLDTCAENDWNIECLCFDPANASKLMMDLSNEGYTVEEVFQSHKHLNEATQGFREQVYCGNVLYEYNPVLNFAMSNAVIRTNQGLIKIDKDATTKRIDPVDSTLCGFKLAMYHEFGSSYQEGIDQFWKVTGNNEYIRQIKNAWNAMTRPTVDMDDDELKEWLGITGTKPDVEKEVTYYTCLKMLSETIGKVPLKYYQETPKGRIRAEPSKITRLLTVRPNTIMTPTTLWTTTEMNCQHYGNGYIWMRGTFERENMEDITKSWIFGQCRQIV